MSTDTVPASDSTELEANSEVNPEQTPEEQTPEVKTSGFANLGLPETLMSRLVELNYETPSPVQSLTIPPLLEGKDVVGQAQTGTGKTAAFALPLLARIDLSIRQPQALILAPTRELAIQVTEAFEKYAANIKGFNALSIYGGQDYGIQLRALKRGIHVVVGTPGRVMDHMRRGTLKLDALHCLILDEADEMLRMGFAEDVEWILDQTPVQHQIALFSATMPPAIRRIASKYLNNPEHLTVKNKTATASTIRQKYWFVQGHRKFAALARILEGEATDGVIIFVRTKSATVEVAEKLSAYGYSAAALNGDIPQNQRERTVERLKAGKVDIVVATDVAARGLDVERISHVFNYDLPRDPEIYVHRIGRTGRAGREGDAIAFVSRNEKHLLRIIERTSRHQIEEMTLPTADDINALRISKFKEKIANVKPTQDTATFQKMIEEFQEESELSVLEIAAALAKLAHGNSSFFLKEEPEQHRNKRDSRNEHGGRERNYDRSDRNRGREGGRGRERSRDRNGRGDRDRNSSERARSFDKKRPRKENQNKKEFQNKADRKRPQTERPQAERPQAKRPQTERPQTKRPQMDHTEEPRDNSRPGKGMERFRPSSWKSTWRRNEKYRRSHRQRSRS